MNLSSIYMVIVLIFLSVGIHLLTEAMHKNQYIKFKKMPVRGLKIWLMSLNGEQVEEHFINAGIKLPMKKYIAARNLIGILAAVFVGIKLIAGGEQTALRLLCLVAGIYYVTAPVLTYGKQQKETLFKKTIDILGRRHQIAVEEELMELTMHLKNIVITEKENPRSADYILETLLPLTTLVRKPLMDTLSFLRRGKEAEAYRQMEKQLKSPLAKNLANILSKIDHLIPSELAMQLEGLQQYIREEKKTRHLARQEQAGHKIFIMASILITFIMFDYMYILFNFLMLKMNF